MPRPLTLLLTLAAALLLSGCATDRVPETRAAFANSTVNGRPAYVWLDTGSYDTFLTGGALDHLDLHKAPLPAGTDNPNDAPRISTPVHVTLGASDFIAQFPIRTDPWYFRWPFSMENTDIIVGWPAVRDNILVFDPANHTISRADTLPPEVSTWTKFKILRTDDHLLLQATLPDGSAGDILIDTGSPMGVNVAPAAWKAWNATHPDAPNIVTGYSAPDAGWRGIWEDNPKWAANITLGPITLTDVPANRASWIESSLSKNYLGTFGMYALGHLDLVLDGKSGFAYLHPHPPNPGPVFRGDWTIAPNVQLSLDSMLLQVAITKFNLGDFNGSLADLDHVIALSPNNADAYNIRGLVRTHRHLPGAEDDLSHSLALDPTLSAAYSNRAFFRLDTGNYTGAVADYTRAVALETDSASDTLFLGVVLECAGNYSGALAAYNQTIALLPDSVLSDTVRLRSQLMQLLLGAHPSSLAKIAAGWSNDSPKIDAQFIDGDLSEAQYLFHVKQGSSEGDRAQQCVAWNHIGMMRLIHHDPVGARAAFQKSVATKAASVVQIFLSRAELSRLLANPSQSAPIPPS